MILHHQMVVCVGQSIKYLLVSGKSLSKVYNVNQCENCVDMRMTYWIIVTVGIQVSPWPRCFP